MRRHEALVPLTHDHHRTLQHARQLRLAARTSPQEGLDAARSFLEHFDTQAVRHFREEEEQLLPLVIDHADAPIELITRVLLEHVRIHRLVADLRAQVEAGGVAPDALTSIAELVQAHVRAEENELFPAIERLVEDGRLRAWTSGRGRR